MAAKDIKIFLKTVADLSGLTKLGTYLKQHVTAIGAVKVAYAGLKTAGAAALKGLGAAWSGLKTGALSVGAAMGGSVVEFVAWNKEAARAWTMMDTGVAGFVSLRKEISKLSSELGVAKSELGKGWYQALSAGVAQDQLIPFLRTAGKVAVADGSSIETAIDGITTVLNAYAKPSTEAAAVTDQMFKAVAKGKTTFSDLASYISQAAPAASAMGVGLDQVLAAVVTLTKQGVPTSTAMVQIRNAMLTLNTELGDGWAKSMTLQEGLEKVASGAGYSATAIEKAFGKENITGVLAMTGAAAKGAAADLADMQAQSGGLQAAFDKVDSQVGHWPRVWQSIRAVVSDVGEAIDTSLRPAINYISQKLQSLRDSGGFAALIESIGAKVAEIATSLIAGVQTAVDVLGKATLGGAISAAVNGLVDMAVTLIAEGLRSMGVVMVALAKVFSAALREDFMKIDIWGRDEEKSARAAALKKVKDLTPEQASSLGVPQDFIGQDSMMTPEQLAEKQSAMSAWANSLSLDQAAKIASSSRDTDVDAAITAAFTRFSESRSRMGGAGERVVGNLSGRTGVDIPALYASNLESVRGLWSQPAASAQAPQSAAAQAPQAAQSAAAQQSTAAVESASSASTDAQAAAAALSEATALFSEGFRAILSEATKLRQAAADAADRAKRPGG